MPPRSHGGISPSFEAPQEAPDIRHGPSREPARYRPFIVPDGRAHGARPHGSIPTRVTASRSASLPRPGPPRLTAPGSGLPPRPPIALDGVLQGSVLASNIPTS